MPKLKQIILIYLAVLISLTVVSCGAAAPGLENTPLPAVTPTPEDTPVPTATPPPAAPAMEGYADVGKYGLVYECYGEGSPTVIVEAGGGDKPVVSFTWKPVIQGVYNTTRICIYNRAEVRTSEDEARDLHTLLGQISVPGPYIIVAHSLGGFNARVFTHLYPEEVAGLILVDTTTLYEDSIDTFATAFPTYSPKEDPGITRDRNYVLTATPLAEFGSMDLITSAEQVRQAGSLGDLPLIVIMNSNDIKLWTTYYPWADADDAERLAAAAQSLQADLATLSSKGVLLIAKDSGHYVSLNEPEIVIGAIIKMVEEVRDR